MADFNNSADPVLGGVQPARCFNLAAAEDATIDEASGLTESDLVMILKALHRFSLDNRF